MDTSRRDFVVQGGAALAGAALLHAPLLAQAFPSRQGEKVVPWLDRPPPNPVPDVVGNQLDWEELDAWVTPNERFFSVSHYGRPVIDPAAFRLEIAGRVAHPLSLSLDELEARPRREVTFTVECGGNHGFPWFQGGIGNARWAGTPLARVLEQAGVLADGIEVVFFGADVGEEQVRDVTLPNRFARSMSLADAMSPDNLLCYEMNGAALPQANGFPLRLIAPGWYGVANVKWLTRIEVWPTRYMGKFMARDYVTIREETRNGETLWTESSVGRARLKSVPAKVTEGNGRHRIVGAAWGAPVAAVEVRIDDGPWRPAALDRSETAEHAWVMWHHDWDASPGEHAITSRAIDVAGEVQPAPDDPSIAGKHTYWESNGQVTRQTLIG